MGELHPDDANAVQVADLRRALAAGELSLVYQPVVDAKARSLAGVEALARWERPGRGFVSPDQFIPLAEAAGLIEAITDFVVERACRDLGPLLARHPKLKLSINLAAREALPDRVARVLDIATRCGVAPNRLQFEITERTLLGQGAEVATALDMLAASGAMLAIDDFGTGYSSLSYLDGYPIQCLKIDKSFVQRLADSARIRKLTEAILLMAGALGMQTVAEGVETIDQLAFLIGKGCRYIQGYLFSKPLPVAQLEAFVAAFAFPDALLDAAMWPRGLTLPRLLADNQERALRLFVEHVPAAVAMFDPAMRYVAASARWLANYRLADVDVIGRCHYDLSPRTPQAWRDVHARCLAGAVESGEDDSYVQPDGTREWTSWEVRPLTNPVGDVVGIVIFAERITARKQAEQRLNDFLAASSDWLWEMDADLRFLPGSGPTGERPSRTVDTGRLAREMTSIAPGQTDLMRAHFADLAAHRPFRNFVHARLADGGEIEWREVSGQPIFAADGSFRGYRGTSRDVTERQRALATLREKVVQLELAGELAGLGYWQWDAARNVGTWSDEVFRIVGRDPATMRLDDNAGRFEIFHPDERQAVSDTIGGAMAEGKPFHLRARVLRPDGGVRIIWTGGRAELSEDGTVARYIGIAQDITDQFELAAGRARSEEENRVYRAIIEALPDLVFAKDLDGRYIVANPATLASFGMTAPDQLLGKSDGDLSAAERAAMSARQDRAVFSAIEVPLRDAAGHVVGLVGVQHDVTELVQAREAAAQDRQTSELYRLGIETLPDLFYVKDTEHRFLVANRALALQVGAASVADLIGRTDADFHSPALAAGYRAEEAAVMARGEAVVVEQQSRRHDGTMGWFSSRKSPLRDASGKIVGIVGYGRDVTQAKQAEMAMRRQIEERQSMAETLEQSRQEVERVRDTLAEAAAVATDGFALFDPDDRLVLCNQPYSALFGLQPADLAGLAFRTILNLPRNRAASSLDDAAFAAWVDLRIASHRAADGAPFEVAYRDTWKRFQERRTKDGYVVLSCTDITLLKTTQADARELANRDEPTGLPDRRSFLQSAARRFAARTQDAPHAGQAALVLFDIDHFTAINDSYGRDAGDEVLRHLARSCAGWLRPSDLLARWGGGEFVLLLPTDEAASVLAVVDRLRRGIAAMTSLSGESYIRVTASFGVALGHGAAGGLDTLVEQAGRALRRAKKAGRNRIEVAARAPGITEVA